MHRPRAKIVSSLSPGPRYGPHYKQSKIDSSDGEAPSWRMMGLKPGLVEAMKHIGPPNEFQQAMFRCIEEGKPEQFIGTAKWSPTKTRRESQMNHSNCTEVLEWNANVLGWGQCLSAKT